MGMIRKLLLALLIIQITPTLAASSASFIPPYEATYSTIWEKGVSFRVEGTQTLTKKNTNDWHFEFSADTLLASLSESVSFHTTNDSIRPHKYHYKSRVLNKTREAELTFNWKNMTVRNDVDSKPWTMPITQNTVDRLGLQLQVRYDLIQGKQNLKYDVADGGKIKHYRFKKGKTEHIDTKLGKLKVIKVIRTDNMTDDRQSYFWFAPEKNYLLVKMVHNEDGESYTLDLEKVSPL
ncbi:DUF3108 domain-containing protein [Marinomonas piezotolerans]|uniref:DUF3108 domain-containing protein n=1 Tax=Marinomonas piezotolerans TaxID=2213058 RepID=A0A370U7R6_9GAMM|nr:DUF3108 domain-containing protein [Marinomonas piezotolerans]RDL43836.1 DUF3108 domain-containing protein [Marinomonas piezotolerans]